MKAKPVPLLTTSPTFSIPKLCAKFPSMANMVKPPIKLVRVSIDVTIIASLDWGKLQTRQKIKKMSTHFGNRITYVYCDRTDYKMRT